MTIYSMTAFGQATLNVGIYTYTVNTRVVNSKGLDIRCHLPDELIALESLFRKKFQAVLSRGKVDLKIKTLSRHLPTQGEPSTQRKPLPIDEDDVDKDDVDEDEIESYFEVNFDLIDDLLSAQRSIQRHCVQRMKMGMKMGMKMDHQEGLSLSDLLQWPQVLYPRPPPLLDVLKTPVLSAISSVISQIVEMRTHEGAQLLITLLKHLKHIERLTQQIESAIPQLERDQKIRLQRRLTKLLSETSIDEDHPRFTLELALLAERGDVSEEITRLYAHIHQMRSLLNEGRPEGVGRRCDFLCQELLREANTTTSKVNDTYVTHLVVELKSEIERLREQIQNIE